MLSQPTSIFIWELWFVAFFLFLPLLSCVLLSHNHYYFSDLSSHKLCKSQIHLNQTLCFHWWKWLHHSSFPSVFWLLLVLHLIFSLISIFSSSSSTQLMSIVAYFKFHFPYCMTLALIVTLFPKFWSISYISSSPPLHVSLFILPYSSSASFISFAFVFSFLLLSICRSVDLQVKVKSSPLCGLLILSVMIIL